VRARRSRRKSGSMAMVGMLMAGMVHVWDTELMLDDRYPDITANTTNPSRDTINAHQTNKFPR
jgi:hypothetical protein